MPNDVQTKKQPAPGPAEKARAKDKVLRAIPLEGKVDYAELSREHIERYPKIRARLAE